MASFAVLSNHRTHRRRPIRRKPADDIQAAPGAPSRKDLNVVVTSVLRDSNPNARLNGYAKGINANE